MKFPNQLWRFRRNLCAALILFLPATLQSQPQDTVGSQTTAQIARIVQELHSRRLNAEQVSAARAIGFKLLAAARYEDARSIFLALVETAPNDQEALYGVALALFNLKQLKEAEERARAAIDSAIQQATLAKPAEQGYWRSRQSDALVLLAVILAVKGDNAGALTAVSDAVNLTPESFDAQFAYGRALYGAGDLTKAAVAFRKAITLQPQNSQSRFFLATALEGLGEYEQAREAYSELIRIHPQQAEGHLGLGVLLLKQANKTEEGISELSEAVRLKGDLYEARIALGRALIKVGRSAEALEHLNRAAVLAPGNPEPHYQLAIAYRRLGKTDGAERESAKVKEINSSRRKGTITSNSKTTPDHEN